MTTDELFMLRALELAHLGIGMVSPNPQVGCVVVHNGKIIGEGWHRKYGAPHAEVNAIQSVENKSLLAESVVYVTLEPCSHFGKTPPCADLLIQHQVKKVIVATEDTNPIVGGKGINKLRTAGIETVVGVLENQARKLNKRFFTYVEKKRPYIILKWAQTADGFIAHRNFDPKWISNTYSRQLVHRWRSEEDAILVGSSTALHDNPSLTVRDWTGKNPIRLVIDRNLKLPHALHLFDGSTFTICFNEKLAHKEKNTEFVKLEHVYFIDQMLTYLYEHKIQSVIVEGGAQTLSLFIEQQWDEARIFTSPQFFTKGIKAPLLSAKQVQEKEIANDRLQIFYPNQTD